MRRPHAPVFFYAARDEDAIDDIDAIAGQLIGRLNHWFRFSI
jgi:hypothetical protein